MKDDSDEFVDKLGLLLMIGLIFEFVVVGLAAALGWWLAGYLLPSPFGRLGLCLTLGGAVAAWLWVPHRKKPGVP